MASKIKKLLPSINGILPGSLAGTVGTLDLPLGLRYHEIELVYLDGTGAPTDMLAMFGDIIVYRNGIPARTHAALELDHLNGLDGSQYTRQQKGAGAAMRQAQTIFFAEPWRKDESDTDYMAWSVDGPNGFNSFQIKLTLLTTFPASGSIMAYARVDSPIAPAKGSAQSVKKVYLQQFPASGLPNDLTTFDKPDGYQVIALKHPTGSYIQYATLKWGPTIDFENVNQQDNVNDVINLGMNQTNSIRARERLMADWK